MSELAFTQQMEAMSSRLVALYEEINTSSSSELLSSALKELGIASERLQVAAAMLQKQQKNLTIANDAVELERQRYRELLEFIPDACLITDTSGMIQAANRAAATLFNFKQSLLPGKFLTNFITPTTQQQFQSDLKYLHNFTWTHKVQMHLQPYQDQSIVAIATAEVSRKSAHQPQTMRWLIRELSAEDRQIESTTQHFGHNIAHQGQLQLFRKREMIPLEPQVVWQVYSGLVKLTAFSDGGEEVLVGLAGASAPFGSSLTALPVYQAVALADTQVRCIALDTIATSTELKQTLLPQITQRLKQTEALLAIYGQRRVEDRLLGLLTLLKHEIGQPVAGGIRLSVRLTHEDLASACGSTRVTITRLLSKLQKQQTMSIDHKHHFVFASTK